ncbi:hypothetical protein [Halobacterium rubrum]|uniref:hypothetical protein n=1 Tax=Halobacterium TaxID=2239 RepID=UPI001F3E1E92|nr:MULTISPECIES: hypothetical protein [Halobacterium]MDH5021712.1 hypothetical protein [Halobacterium rubrum]
MVNIPGIGIPNKPLKWLADKLVGGAIDAVENVWRGFTEWFFNIRIPQTDGPFIFGEPTCAGESICEIAAIQDQVWFGEMTGLMLFTLYLLFQIRVAGALAGFGSRYEMRKQRKEIIRGAFLIIGWYPLALGTWALSNWMALELAPDVGEFANAMAQFATSSAITAAVSGPLGWLIIGITALLALVLKLLFEIRPLLFFFYLALGQFFLVLRYSGLPVAKTIGSRALTRLVPVCLMPIPTLGMAKLYSWIFIDTTGGVTAGTVSGNVLMLAFLAISLWATWRMFKFASPRTAAAIGGTAKMTAGVAAGGAIVASGGSSYLGAQAVSGNTGRAALLHAARQPGNIRNAASNASQAVSNARDSVRRTENNPDNDPLDPWGHNQ